MLMKRLCFVAIILGFAVILYAEDALNIPPAPTAAATAAATIAPAVDNTPNAGNQGYRLTLDVDFVTVTMTQANDALVGNNPGYTSFGGGFSGVLDLGFAAYPFLLLGPRVGYLFCLPANFEKDFGGGIHKKTSMGASIIPVEAGGRLRFVLPFTSAGISVGAYGGVCFAHVQNNVKVTNTLSQEANYIEPYDGFGFSGEVNAAIELKLAKGVDFNVNAGYRLAGVPSVKQSADAYYTFPLGSPVLVSNKDNLLRNSVGAIVPFDYSGLNIGVGISLGY
jgi:hypothetical protein